MKTAIYYRVSTSEQTNEPQRRELLDYCARRGWDAPAEYADTISGAKFTRFGLDRLMADVRRGKIKTIIVVKLDRLGRSLPHLAQLIAELDAASVGVIATTQGIDTSEENPAGRLQMHVLMAVAQFERSLICERTRAGLANARAKGVRLGREPWKVTPERAATIRRFVSSRKTATANGVKPPSYPSLARQLGCSLGKAHALGREALKAA